MSTAIAHLRALDTIARNSMGNRALGSLGFGRSVEYVAAVLRNAGYDPLIYNFSVTRFSVQPNALLQSVNSTGYVLSTLEYKSEFDVLTYSGSDDVTMTAFLASNFGCSASDFLNITIGSIAVVRRGSCYFRVKVVPYWMNLTPKGPQRPSRRCSSSYYRRYP